MAISKLVDNRKYEKKTIETCQLNSKDCMFLDKADNTCRAEWCIYKELPEMVKLNVKLTCEVCKKNSTTVSVYSGETKYICDECLEKIKNRTESHTCEVCGASISYDRSICSSCGSKLRRIINRYYD